MKKNKLLNVLLILLPVMAIALAFTVDSVTVFDPVTGTTEHYSYFSLIPRTSMAILPPMAALLCVAAEVLAVIVVVKKKTGCGRWLKWVSFAAAMVAVTPILLRGEELLVVPNVLLPILMLAEYVILYFKAKTQTAEQTGKKPKSGPRLG